MFSLKTLFSRLGDVNKVILLLWLLTLVGLLSLLVPAGVKLTQHDWSGALTVLGSGLFMAGASTLAGAVIGFLFGVPRRHDSASNGDNPGSDITTYRPNTNLEQISDWLTKIIVGVGLIQFPQIIRFFKTIANDAGPAFGTAPSGNIIALSIVIHYMLVGFFQGFLLAYLWLPGAFARAAKAITDEDMPKSDLSAVEKIKD
ncbi:MAG TPA: hypothetical protein VJ810_30440 [Blastocatellia bacterium]|nr:hypothetical protein [Blastocatellia bacterium]